MRTSRLKVHADRAWTILSLVCRWSLGGNQTKGKQHEWLHAFFYFHTSDMSQRYCPNCNFTTNNSSVAYCPRCGKPLVEQNVQPNNHNIHFCPNCGKPNSLNATFCASCGKPLTSQPEEKPTQNTCPPSYLVWSILTTILCCLPFGIISIVFANKVEKLWYMGQYKEAQNASEKAKIWAIASAASSAVIFFFWFIFMIIAS